MACLAKFPGGGVEFEGAEAKRRIAGRGGSQGLVPPAYLTAHYTPKETRILNSPSTCVITDLVAHQKLISRELTTQTDVVDSLACSVHSPKTDPRRLL